MHILFMILGRIFGTLLEGRMMGWVSKDDTSGLLQRYGLYLVLAVIGVAVVEMLLIATGHESIVTQLR
ncbi:MAG: hypothetical protein ABJG15_14150 [Hyphomonadaceae bacterium]